MIPDLKPPKALKNHIKKLLSESLFNRYLDVVLGQLANDLGNLGRDSAHDLALAEVAGDQDSLGLLKDETLLTKLSHDSVIDGAGDDVLLPAIGQRPLASGGDVVEDGSVVLLLSSRGLPRALGAAASTLEADDGAAVGDLSNWWQVSFPTGHG